MRVRKEGIRKNFLAQSHDKRLSRSMGCIFFSLYPVLAACGEGSEGALLACW